MPSAITHPITGHHGLSKPIQFVEEGLTPADWGVTPTASPVFNLCGAIQEMSDTPTRETFIKRTLGQRKYYANIVNKDRITLELKFAPFNSTFIKYGSQEANGTGTIAAPITIARIQKLNNAGSLADSFVFYKGMRCNTLDISVAGQEVEATMSFIGYRKTQPVFTANGGLTTPTWKEFADMTALPWTNIDGGTNPLTIDGVTYPTKAFHCNWNNNITPDDLNGSQFIDQNQQANRDITGDFTILVGKDFNLEADMDTFPMPEVAASYVLKSSVSTITFTKMALTQRQDSLRAEDNSSYSVSFNFTAQDASIS